MADGRCNCITCQNGRNEGPNAPIFRDPIYLRLDLAGGYGDDDDNPPPPEVQDEIIQRQGIYAQITHAFLKALHRRKRPAWAGTSITTAEVAAYHVCERCDEDVLEHVHLVNERSGCAIALGQCFKRVKRADLPPSVVRALGFEHSASSIPEGI